MSSEAVAPHHHREIGILGALGLMLLVLAIFIPQFRDLQNGIFSSPPADRGEAFLRARKVNFREPKDAMSAGIAYVPEDRKMIGLVLGGSVGTNISSAAPRSVAWGPFVDQLAENRLIK